MGWFSAVALSLITATALPLAGSAGTLAGSTGALSPDLGPKPDPFLNPADTDVLALKQERYSRLTVPVTIGDHGPFNFMIDTGAQATVLSRDLADRLMLGNRRPATLVGMASLADVEVASVDDVTLGSRMFDIQTAPLVAKRNLGMADGILGLDSLQNQRVLIDFRKRTIAVADADQLGGNMGYEIVVKARRRLGQLIITNAVLDGIRVAVIIDTGLDGNVGNLALQRKLNSRKIGSDDITDINGRVIPADIRVASSLRMDRVSLTNVPVMLADAPLFHALDLQDEPALVLGLSQLKMFRRVAIDFREGRILFDIPRSLDQIESIYGGKIGGL